MEMTELKSNTKSPWALAQVLIGVVHLGFIQFVLLKRKEKKASKKTNTYSQRMQLLCLFLPIAVPKENPMLCTYRRQKKREGGGGVGRKYK